MSDACSTAQISKPATMVGGHSQLAAGGVPVCVFASLLMHLFVFLFVFFVQLRIASFTTELSSDDMI